MINGKQMKKMNLFRAGIDDERFVQELAILLLPEMARRPTQMGQKRREQERFLQFS